jgi:hypothetical protein
VEDLLGRCHAAEVHHSQHRGESTVDEGAVYEGVYLVEAVSRNARASGRSLQPPSRGEPTKARRRPCSGGKGRKRIGGGLAPIALRRVSRATKLSMRQRGGSSHQLLDPDLLPLLSQHHSTAPPFRKRYGYRYEDSPTVEGTTFRERDLILGTWMNKWQEEGLGFLAASATNLRPQLLTHSLKLSITASRLSSHHSASYLTPTSRYAVGS